MTKANYFVDELAAAIVGRGTPVLVGLDPRTEQLPAGLMPDTEGGSDAAARAFGEFCRGVIDVVAPLVAAVKPQAAMFEQLGPAGMVTLAEVIRYARQKQLLVILDGKRNDIGSTALAYADGYLGRESVWGADALTVNPYLGDDTLDVMVDVAVQRQAGLFVLVKTSNPGSGTFQDLISGGKPIYQHVATHVQSLAARTQSSTGYGTVGAVVGATYPEQIGELRSTMPNAWLLVPGFGAQGATAKDVAGAFDEEGLGAVVNSSRGIIFAHRRSEYCDRFGASRWQEAVEAATRDMIDQLATETPAGRLV